MLEFGVVGHAQRATQGELAIQHPGNIHPLSHCPHRGQHHGGDPGFFQYVGQRTHGARAQRSNRGQDGHVHPVGPQLGGRSRAGVEAHLRHRVGLVAGERHMPGGHGPDGASSGQFL